MELSKQKRIDLEKLTKDLESIDPKIKVSVIETDDKKEIILDGYDEKKSREILETIENHNPEKSTEEQVLEAVDRDFDEKLKESLLRLGFTLPKK